MAYTTPQTTPTPAPSGQSADTPAALPFGVSGEQYGAALADAQSRGFYDPNEPTMNSQTKALEQAITAFPEVDSPEQYDLSQYPVDDSGDAAATMEFDAWRRSALQAAGVPAEMAGGLVSACVDAERRFQNQTPDQRELQISNANAAMAKLWGDKATANLELANKFLDYVESRQPGVIEYLDASGAANDVFVIAAVVAQAERFIATGGKL